MKTNDLSMLGELLSNAEKEQKNQQQTSQAKPTPKKQKPVKKAKAAPATQVEKDDPQAKPAEAKNKIDDKKLESVMKAVDEYIYGNTSLYAKEIIEAAGEKDVALSILKHLNSEAERKTKRGAPKIKRSNLFKLTVAVGAENFADEDVKQSLRILLYEISDRCQDDFISYEINKETFKDDFLQYIPTVENVARKAGMVDFINEIANIHSKELYAKLDEASQEKYMTWLTDYSAKADERAKAKEAAALKKEAEKKAREEERKRKAEERIAAKAKAEAEKKDKTKEDIAPENETREQRKKDKTKTAEDTSTPTQPKKGDTIMADEKELTPEQKQELEKYKDIAQVTGVDISSITSETYKDILAALKKAENDFGVVATDGKSGKPEEEAGKEDETDDKDKPMEFNTGPVKEKEPETKEEAPEIAEWVKEKRVEYQKRFENKEIAGYEFDPNEKVGFAAHVEGGYIHYTNKYSVTVSPDSKLKVFEALVTEGHNKGRPVNFGPNLEHKQAVLLLAACLIHGNPVGNNPPELSPEDLEMLKRDLEGRTIKDETGKEIPAYAALEESLAKYTAKGGEEKKKEGTDKTAETEGDKPKAFDDETKGKIKEALEHQYELSAMESSGNLRKDDVTGDMYYWEKNSKTGVEAVSPEKTREYKKLKDNQAEEKGFLAKKFVENTDEVRAIAGEVVNDRHKEKIEKLRKEMAQKKGAKEGTTLLDEHNDRATRVAAKQEEMKIALGIKDPEKGLKGDALKEYISKNNISQFTYTRLLAKENEGKAPDQQKKANDAVYNMCNKTSAILTKDKENGGK